MLDSGFLAAQFTKALDYEAYLESGSPSEREAFERVGSSAPLTEEQRSLLGSFSREVRVIVLSGMWCGDCVAQCPLIAAIASANPSKILVRFADRDEHEELSSRVTINRGRRVPCAIFMSEDHEFVHVLGDRTLSRYRSVAAKQLGAACELPTAGVSSDDAAACLEDWVREFERVELLLRLSPRLRQKHGD